MDNLSNISPDNNDSNEPIPFDESEGTSISHAPLNLGGSDTAPLPTPTSPPARTVVKKQEQKVSSTDRITGVRTFFTKLHAGAIDFLSEQITEWLKKNPGIKIKQTNTTIGEIQAKKTEPNIIITVWY